MGDEADALNDMYGFDEEIRESEREHTFYENQKAASLQRQINAAVKKALRGAGVKKKTYSKGKMITVKCKACQNDFEARVADRKRGWAKFCSKSCKAKKQESKTHNYRTYMRNLT